MLRLHGAPAAVLLVTLGNVPAAAEHVQDFDRALRAFAPSRDLRKAESLFLEGARQPGRNQLLCLYELGSFYHWAGDCARSAAAFAQADQVARTYEGKALASVSGGLGQVGAALTNDKVLPWEGAGFEKVMSRTLNALNYLALDDAEGARVEVRKAEEYQVKEHERSRREVEEASARDGEQPATMATPALASAYRGMASFARNLRNSYENAFTYYLSSQIYRAQGPMGLNDALVDIKRAFALAPDVPAVREAYQDLLARNESVAAKEDGSGTVVVLYEAGLVPRMSEVKIDLPIREKRKDGSVDSYRLSMAFPIYKDFGQPEPALRVRTPAFEKRTARVVDLRPMAVKALEERMPGILARSLVGAAAKVEGQKQAEELGGILARLAVELATGVVTRADLRSWLGLPAEIQAAQFQAPAGTGDVVLSNGLWTEKVALEVVPGGTTFLMVRSFPGFRTVKAVAIKGDA